MKNLFKFIFLLFSFNIFFPLVFSKVIVIHGILERNAKWYLPGGCFYEALAKKCKDRGQEVISFSWEQSLGGITHYERIKAGRDLVKLILSFLVNEESIDALIGNNYGGLVIKVASQILSYVLLDFKTEELYKNFLLTSDESTKGSFKHMYNQQKIKTDLLNKKKRLEKKNDKNKEKANQALVENLEMDSFFQQACFDVLEYIENLKLKGFKIKDETEKFLINAVYTLGTPNNLSDYKADMNVIKYLYNFYSKGDFIQDIMGDRLLPEPKHPRSVNLCVEMKNSGWFSFLPFLNINSTNHLKLHAEIIGNWILDIPFEMQKINQGGFDKFTFDFDGKVNFYKDEVPSYEILVNKDKEDGLFAKYDFSWLLNLPDMKILKNCC